MNSISIVLDDNEKEMLAYVLALAIKQRRDFCNTSTDDADIDLIEDEQDKLEKLLNKLGNVDGEYITITNATQSVNNSIH